MRTWKICLTFFTCFSSLRAATKDDSPAILSRSFVYDEAPFPQCHASTIVETPTGMVAAWFGGEREKHPSVGIWLSRLEAAAWTIPVEVANGNQPAGDVKRYPCWNPVLFQRTGGPLILFFKVGPSAREWWGEVSTSADGGKTWSAAQRLPRDIFGPIKNKPIELSDGMILCGSSTEHDGWRVHFETTNARRTSWNRTPPINDGREFGIIQPTILRQPDGGLLALCRSRQGTIVATSSLDDGKTWSEPRATSLPNPNSGIDGVTLKDGRQVVVYNHTNQGRTPLNVAISVTGTDWKNILTLESDPGEYSYPAIVQGHDGRLHITYTWRRERIRYVVLDTEKL
jgi:predicted neuraminidase